MKIKRKLIDNKSWEPQLSFMHCLIFSARFFKRLWRLISHCWFIYLENYRPFVLWYRVLAFKKKLKSNETVYIFIIVNSEVTPFLASFILFVFLTTKIKTKSRFGIKQLSFLRGFVNVQLLRYVYICHIFIGSYVWVWRATLEKQKSGLELFVRENMPKSNSRREIMYNKEWGISKKMLIRNNELE